MTDKRKSMAFYYTYLWLREDGTPYYVGKGKGYRAFDKHDRRNRDWSPPPEDRILIQEFPDEESALEAEKFLISFYGRIDSSDDGCLRNLTDGGDAPPRTKVFFTPLMRRVRSERLKAQIANGWGCKWQGRKHSAESREKMRLAHIGHGENRLGRKHSEETKRKISETKKRNKERPAA